MRIAIVFVAAMVTLPVWGQEKPRVYVAPNTTWRAHEDASGRAGVEVENRTLEIANNFAQSCKEVTVNAGLSEADYVIEVNRRTKFGGVGGGGILSGVTAIVRTDISVYHLDGDLVGGISKSSVGAAVKGACNIIKKNWTGNHLPHAPRTQQKANPGLKPASLPE